MSFPKYVFVYTADSGSSYPSTTKFTWHPVRKALGPEPGATPELLDELVSTGLVDETEQLNISEWSKKLTCLPDSVKRLTALRTMRIETSQFVGWENLYHLTSLRTLVLAGRVRRPLTQDGEVGRKVQGLASASGWQPGGTVCQCSDRECRSSARLC